MSADVFVQAVPLLSFCEVSPHSPLLPEFDSSAPRELDQHAPPGTAELRPELRTCAVRRLGARGGASGTTASE